MLARAGAILAIAAVANGCASVATAPLPLPVSASAAGVSGVPLHYLDFGGRGSPVILLAGAGNTARIYSDFGRELARDHRTLALTRRGHGSSGSPAKGYSIDVMAEDLRLFLDQRGLDRAVLIGHSLAGAELTHFAGKYPDRVSALVYLDAAYDRSTQEKSLESDPIAPNPPTTAERASVDGFVGYVRRTRPDLRRYWTAAVEQDLRASVVMKADGTVGWVTGAMFGEYWTSASVAPPDYSRIKVPALAIYSVEDEAFRLLPAASIEKRAAMRGFELGPLAKWRNASIAQFRAQLAKRQVAEMNAGHHLFLDRPGETLGLIRAFLKKYKLQ